MAPMTDDTRQQSKMVRRDRILRLAAITALWILVWVGAVLIFSSNTTNLALTVISGVIIGGIFWTAFAAMTRYGEPYFMRFWLVWLIPVAIWTPIMLVLIAITTQPVILIPSGIAILVVLFILALAMPVWVVEIQPGEVYYYRALQQREWEYELLTCETASEQATRASTPIPEPQSIEEAVLHDVLIRQQSQQAPQEPAHTIHDAEYRWIRLMDEFRPLWHLYTMVWVRGPITGINTYDRASFDISVSLGFKFDPARIQSPDLARQIPNWKSPEQVQEIVTNIARGIVDRNIREYYSELTYENALSTASLTQLKKVLPQKLAGIEKSLGLKLAEALTSITVKLDEQITHAANERIASISRAVAKETLGKADIRLEMERLTHLMDMIYSGNYDAEVLLMAYLAQKSDNLHRLPELLPGPDRFHRVIQLLRQGDQRTRKRVVNYLVSTEAARPGDIQRLTAPASGESPIAISPPGAVYIDPSPPTNRKPASTRDTAPASSPRKPPKNYGSEPLDIGDIVRNYNDLDEDTPETF